MKHYLYLITLFLLVFNNNSNAQFIDWENLENPVYFHEGWSTKDACMVYHEESKTFYIFFSAFYFDEGRERSHVTGVKTKDFKTFSDPLFIWDGKAEGWIGQCSPNINRIGDKYILTYNTWGDKKGKPNQLFYAISTDLENWDKDKPLAHNLTSGKRAIDASMAYHNNMFFLSWKGEKGKSRMAWSKDIASEFAFINFGYPVFLMEGGGENGMIHENYEYLNIDEQWYCLSTDYAYNPYREHAPYLYRLRGESSDKKDWLLWEDGCKIEIPVEEGFNTSYAANASFICDWRKYDGYFYMLYAGRTENKTHAKRGDNKLGLARSKDLINWSIGK